VKRALLAAAFLALAGASTAVASVPLVPGGSAVGGDLPLKAYASLTPPVHLFGDSVTAKVAVVADTKWVNPARLRVTANFEPYEPTHPPTELRIGSGRFLQITWTWTLRCLTTKCVPVVPPSDHYHIFQFRPARIDYLNEHGGIRYEIAAHFPPVEALSEVSPGVVKFLNAHHALNWQYQLAPVAAPRYRVSPGVIFWLALALAGLLGAFGILLTGRWALQFRRPAPAAAPALPPSTLERALALFFWARAHGDETLQRKALERVADELPIDVHDLSETARELAWSPETPEGEDVQAISDRAGLGGRRDGEAPE
jgi:hypothetical protein